MLAPRSCQTWGVPDLRERLAEARLYLVCGDVPDAFLDAALRGGVDIVQLRIKDRAAEEIVPVARRFAAICARHRAPFILNDRPELVAAAGADGVHIGQDDVALSEAREVVGEELLVGLSTHTREQIEAAADADYIGVGPVFETPTKPGRPAVGLELVRHAARCAPVPFFAIGGIDVANVAAVASAGAGRVAVVRALARARDPEGAARSLRAALEGGEARLGAA